MRHPVDSRSMDRIKAMPKRFFPGWVWICLLPVCAFLMEPALATGQTVARDTFRLYFLGGQSNMEGHGRVAELPDSLRSGFERVWIFEGNATPDEDPAGGLGLWETLKPGHGAGFTSNGEANALSEKFGPELSFGKSLQRLYPGQKIALIKYARGGSSLDSLAAREYGSWEMDYRGTRGVNQLDHYLRALRLAMQAGDIDQNGRQDVLIPCGIVWMQGESDGCITQAIADRYYDHLKRLMDLLRISLRQDDIPVVLGKISDSEGSPENWIWRYGDRVREAQERFVRTDRRAFLVRDTRFYGYSDPWHYDTDGYIRLGDAFAEAIFRISQD